MRTNRNLSTNELPSSKMLLTIWLNAHKACTSLVLLFTPSKHPSTDTPTLFLLVLQPISCFRTVSDPP